MGLAPPYLEMRCGLFHYVLYCDEATVFPAPGGAVVSGVRAAERIERGAKRLTKEPRLLMVVGEGVRRWLPVLELHSPVKKTLDQRRLLGTLGVLEI